MKIYNKHTHCKSPAENCISWHQFVLHKFVQHSGYDEIKEEHNWSPYPIKTSMIFIKSAVYLCSILVFTVYSFGSVPSYMTCECPVQTLQDPSCEKHNAAFSGTVQRTKLWSSNVYIAGYIITVFEGPQPNTSEEFVICSFNYAFPANIFVQPSFAKDSSVKALLSKLQLFFFLISYSKVYFCFVSFFNPKIKNCLMNLMNFCSSKAVLKIKFAVSHCVFSSTDRKEFLRCSSEEEVTKKESKFQAELLYAPFIQFCHWSNNNLI